MTLSSNEAEYMAFSKTTKKTMRKLLNSYIKKLLNSLGVNLGNVAIKSDNLNAQKLAINLVHHDHFVRDAVKEKMISIEYVSTGGGRSYQGIA